MFWSDPSSDLNVIIFFLAVALSVSFGVYVFTKKTLLSLTILSVLSNIVLYGNSGSRLFDIYNVKYIVVFSLDFWPIINAVLLSILIFNYFKKRNASK